jgi:predicted DNA-binding transcriptional regulator YafY
MEDCADGGVELTLEAGGSRELTDWILSFGAGAEVLEPESLRAQVRQTLEKASALYRGGSASAASPSKSESAAEPGG